MKTIWFKGLSQAEKEDRKKFLLSHKQTFDTLKEVLENGFHKVDPNYDNASWAYKQADVNGANRMLQDIINLIDIKE